MRIIDFDSEPILQFCSLISVMEIPLCKVNAHFPDRFAPIILANRSMYGENIGANRAGNLQLLCTAVSL